MSEKRLIIKEVNGCHICHKAIFGQHGACNLGQDFKNNTTLTYPHPNCPLPKASEYVSKQAVIELLVQMRVADHDEYFTGYDDAICKAIDKIQAMPGEVGE